LPLLAALRVAECLLRLLHQLSLTDRKTDRKKDRQTLTLSVFQAGVAVPPKVEEKKVGKPVGVTKDATAPKRHDAYTDLYKNSMNHKWFCEMESHVKAKSLLRS
jgi:hypothetical protein